MDIKTKSGFTCKVNENKIKDWRFVKALAKCDGKTDTQVLEGLSFVVPFLLGEDGEAALIEHVTDKDGIAPADALITEVREIISLAGSELKKSQSSQG